ncbi:RNase P subunit p30-domain-containing protein [Gigaspora rosea]|uniref:RNase P subunit p30-domain-containing protein n=1 Tax=Gigaspora rosea TaxID=44941 RepID=A0A397UJS0_9GLOM|nr:RNase P subunit p30-domain-containing protein [Gigaspora rosea]
MFYDLNLPYRAQHDLVNKDDLRTRIDMLIKLGYQVVAYNHVVTGKVSPNETNVIDISGKKKTNIEQLTRLTYILEDISQNHGLTPTNNALSTYDILAVRPTNEKTFQNACNTLEIDIISLEMGSRLTFYLKHSIVGLAIERGIFFEISYAPAIRDSTSRRHLISNAQNLVRVSRGKNIIITSEAQRAMELRGPYDIVNLGTIMGMNQAIAKECITTNCRSVVIHAATRRNTHKAVVSFDPITSLKQNELWKVGKDKKSLPTGKSKKAKRMRPNSDDEDESESSQLQNMDM